MPALVFPAKVSINALVEATRKQRPRLLTSARALDTETNLKKHVDSHFRDYIKLY